MVIDFVGNTVTPLWCHIVLVMFTSKYYVLHFIPFEYILNQSVEKYSYLKLFCINKAPQCYSYVCEGKLSLRSS